MTGSSSTLRRDIARGLSLRKYTDPQFAEKVSVLVQWRGELMRAAYRDLAQDPAVAAVLDYYFNEVFAGIDLSEFQGADKTIALAEKLFTGTDMLRSALEFNAIAGEVEERLARELFENMRVSEIDESAFTDAAHNSGVIDDMRRQIECFNLFADDLNTTVADRKVVAAIKLARVPAKMGGFAKTYALVAQGFKALSRTADPEKIAATIAERELAMIDRLASRKRPLYP